MSDQPNLDEHQPQLLRLFPGFLLCAGVGVAAYAVEDLQRWLLGRAWLEGLALAVLLGATVGNFWHPTRSFSPGIRFSSTKVLNASVILLGASTDLSPLAHSGVPLALLALMVVMVSICSAVWIGRRLQLGSRIAVLIGVGNGICGNSAIAATAPGIGASQADVGAAISLTALVGIGQVLILPLLGDVLGMGDYRYGVLCGLSVYAVPQVVAAAYGRDPASGEAAIATKLARVLLLGPVALALGVIMRRRSGDFQRVHVGSKVPTIPFFVLGFLVLAMLRTFAGAPETADTITKSIAGLLFVMSMTGTGLEMRIGALRETGSALAAVTGGSILAVMIVAFVGVLLVA